MSTWNMPPGVSTADIPGNERPNYDGIRITFQSTPRLWQAVRDSYEPGYPIGYGKTPTDAVAELLDLEAD